MRFDDAMKRALEMDAQKLRDMGVDPGPLLFEPSPEELGAICGERRPAKDDRSSLDLDTGKVITPCAECLEDAEDSVCDDCGEPFCCTCAVLASVQLCLNCRGEEDEDSEED